MPPLDTGSALARFDTLPAVANDFMLGSWRGEGCPTGHPLDGALEAYGWWGKRFDSEEAVHPLLFARRGGGTLALNPRWMAPAIGWLDRWPLPKSPTLGRALQVLLPLLATRQSAARLRQIEHRGVVSAAMVYDRLPIHDVFRRIDDDTVMGLMDLKGASRAFFFLLKRQR
ncbi:DUF4334 domain-containing protein [Pelomonas cellulosilytica]|uniref:DUF4334 domain-containing protein n=1 Tax=Pelomonas cellulosilytica TaxID=2906762 RepID=A0ABS8Y2C0_9BURK|nr:DUF4334 domain-containing protein [Pelomonas sp. P8]MCE4557106.1 DUF4334 domain-containing protein [Pelomonas sp. P8]